MGIFDDAIREHLELMRQLGADETELKELEDEAFGPPARPGEPDFPGAEAEVAPAAQEGEVASVEGAEASPVEAPSEQPAPEPAAAEIEESQAAEDSTPTVEAPLPEPEPVEDLEESEEPATGDFEPERVEDEAVSESAFSTAEREAIADQPTVFFDQAEPADFELGDLDLDIDEEIEDVEGSVEEPLTGEEPVEGSDEELLTGEEPVEEPVAEVAEAEPADPETPLEAEAEPALAEPPSEEVPREPAPADSETTEGNEDDVLEETPEFLRDNPDDDELWFEQGEPKDFDF